MRFLWLELVHFFDVCVYQPPTGFVAVDGADVEAGSRSSQECDRDERVDVAEDVGGGALAFGEVGGIDSGAGVRWVEAVWGSAGKIDGRCFGDGWWSWQVWE